MPVSTLRSLVVGARDALDGRLHPARRRKATRRLASLRAESVLFVCLGNVCRSPYGARVLAARAPTLKIQSAGFIGPHRAPPDVALEVARARGIDHADHRSRILTDAVAAEAEAVFVFDRFNVSRIRAMGSVRRGRLFRLGDFDPLWTGKRAIIDPWGKSSADFERTFERIERCVGEVAATLERAREV